MSQTTNDRTRSTFTQQREQREQAAVALATERLPWHPAIGERFGIERSGWRALVEAVFPSAKTTEGVILALSYCKARNLDPFKRVVHVVPIWDSAQKKVVETVWPGIGEQRTTAVRTKLYAGCDEAKFGPDVTRTWTISGKEDERSGARGADREVTVTFPEWAQFTVFRKNGDERWGVPGPRVYWLETYATQSRWTEAPNEMWRKRPRGQLEKCAEAAALRRAFPEELGDEATADEVGDYSGGATIDGEVISGEHQADASQPHHSGATDSRRPDTATPTGGSSRVDERQTGTAERKAPPAAAKEKPAQTAAPKEAKEPTKETRTAPTIDGEIVPPPAQQATAAPTSSQAAPEDAGQQESHQQSAETSQAEDGGADAGFEAWIVDENGNETRPQPYTEPLQFATALATLCAGKPRNVIDDIMAVNNGAISDCCDASEPAAKIINAITDEPAQTDIAPAATNEPEESESAVEATAEDPKKVAWEVVEVELTPKGYQHWPNYIATMEQALDQFKSVADVTAWMEVQKPSYMNKSVQAQTRIERRFNEVIAKLSDPDRQKADQYIRQIEVCATAKELEDMNALAGLIEDMGRWRQAKPDLFNEVRTFAAQRRKTLLGG